jgi:LysM repeat protein
MLEKKIQEDQKNAGIPAQEIRTAKLPEPEPSPYPEGEFTINGRRVLYLPEGTQLIAIANKHHIRLTKLLRFNELKDDVLNRPSLIYLQRKGKQGAHDIHVVSDSESMVSVAAEEGMQLKWLYKWNRLSEDDQVQPGEALYLRGYKPVRGTTSSRRPDKGLFYKLAHLFSGRKRENKPVFTTTAGQPAPSIAPDTSMAEGNNITTPAGKKDENKTFYQVQAGDTLYSISRKYSVTVSQIRQWNGLENDSIRAGQQIIVKK